MGGNADSILGRFLKINCNEKAYSEFIVFFALLPGWEQNACGYSYFLSIGSSKNCERDLIDSNIT
jgi:hypothetical protein